METETSPDGSSQTQKQITDVFSGHWGSDISPDQTAWGAVPSKGPLLVVNVLGVSQPVTTTAATLMLLGEETTLTATMATGEIPFKFAGAG